MQIRRPRSDNCQVLFFFFCFFLFFFVSESIQLTDYVPCRRRLGRVESSFHSGIHDVTLPPSFCSVSFQVGAVVLSFSVLGLRHYRPCTGFTRGPSLRPPVLAPPTPALVLAPPPLLASSTPFLPPSLSFVPLLLPLHSLFVIYVVSAWICSELNDLQCCQVLDHYSVCMTDSAVV